MGVNVTRRCQQEELSLKRESTCGNPLNPDRDSEKTEWKRYVVEPRKQLLVLRKLVEKGRAQPPRRRRAMAPTGLFGRDGLLPDVLFWKVLAYWRSERDV